MSVWTDRPEYTNLLWEMALVRDILGGTRAMRGDTPDTVSSEFPFGGASGTRSGATPWLPRFESDSRESYALRWERAICNGAFSNTIETIVGKAMSDSVRVDAAPDNLKPIEANADRQGTSLQRWVAAHLQRKVAFGGSGILIAMPSKESIPANLLAQDGNVPEPVKERLDIRPYLVPVHRLNVRAWLWMDKPGGGRQLTFLAIREDDRVERSPTGAFICHERLRTWELLDGPDGARQVQVALYERKADAMARKEGDGEAPISKSVLDLPCIPFVWDAVDDSETTSDPLAVSLPLKELAYLQLAHFRETAEQGVAVLAARAECPVEEGCDPEDKNKPLSLTLGRAMRTMMSPQEHRLAFVGPSGKGVEHGEVSLRHIEDAMERIGAQPLARRAGTETATGKTIDNSSRQSIAANWVEATQDAIETAYEIADVFARPTETLPVGKRLEDLVVCIPGLETLTSDQVQIQVEELRAGVRDVGLPKRLYVEALVQNGYVPEGTVVDDVLAEMDQVEADSLTRTFAAQTAALRLVDARGQMGQPPTAKQKQNQPPPGAQGAA